MWVRTGDVPSGDIIIFNVYASILTSERCTLWEELAATLPHDCQWLFGGDWNFVEEFCDKSSLCEKLISDEEKRFFFILIDTLEVEEKFPTLNRI